MADFILFYDSNDDDIVTMAKRRAPEIDAKAIPIRDVPALNAAILSRPYEDQPEFEAFARPPAAREPYRTFCGT